MRKLIYPAILFSVALALNSALICGTCGLKPIKPITPIGCRDLAAQCQCNAAGDCAWVWVCVK